MCKWGNDSHFFTGILEQLDEGYKYLTSFLGCSKHLISITVIIILYKYKYNITELVFICFSLFPWFQYYVLLEFPSWQIVV